MSSTMHVTTSKTDHASPQANGDHTATQPLQSTTATRGGARSFMSKLTRRRRVEGEGDGADRSGGEHASTSSHWRLTQMLENKGSVARDHLANERTFLAWLRTSLSLASIGIAITQLFRLASTSVPTGNTGTASASSSVVSKSTTLHLRSLLQRAVVQNASSNESSITAAEELQTIRKLVLEQAEQILLLQGQVNGNPLKYRHLGKPIGGTFIGLALLFLLLGANRYFSVQSALMREPKSMFPPSRRTVTFTSFCVAAIVIATFAAILAVR